MKRLDPNTEAETKLGRVRGSRRCKVVTFAGVPFAEPPTGSRRFQPPEPIRPWGATFDATSPSVISPQHQSRLVGVMGDFSRTQDEDCLRVTISTPAADNARRPVVVWFHGGGFSSGSGGLDWYDGARLAEEGDVVVVGVNYRLGALGYLFAEGISHGNMGLLDQALALRFVLDNIASFGGDPDNLTLMGQSAGGNSILALFAGGYVPPEVRRVIIQSAAFGMAPQTLQAAQANGVAFLKKLGIDPGAADAKQRLATMPLSELLEAQGRVALDGARYGDTAPPFQLVRAAGISPDKELHLAAAEQMGGVEVLLGSTLDEARAFLARHPHTAELSHHEALQIAADLYGESGKEGYHRLRQQFPHMSAGQLFTELTTYEVFVRIGSEFAKKLIERRSPVHLFEFAYRPKASDFGACHCIELPFVFGMSNAWSGTPMLTGGDPDAMQLLSETVRAAWIAFIRTGRPDALRLPQWQAAEKGNLVAMRLDARSSPKVYGSRGS